MSRSEKAESTRARLIDAARVLFAQYGYAATGTEAILASTGVKRGGLYHHFRDKAALFEAVCRQLGQQAVAAINQAIENETDTRQALVKGSIAWVEFMLRPDVRQILVVDGPTVLGTRLWTQIDQETSSSLLSEGLAEARRQDLLVAHAHPEAFDALVNGALNGLVLRMGEKPLATPDWKNAVEAFMLAQFRTGYE